MDYQISNSLHKTKLISLKFQGRISSLFAENFQSNNIKHNCMLVNICVEKVLGNQNTWSQILISDLEFMNFQMVLCVLETRFFIAV